MTSSISKPTSTANSLMNSASSPLNNALQNKSPADKQSFFTALNQASSDAAQKVDSKQNDELRKQFDKFVGGTFYHQMLDEMQKSVGKSKYMNGGHAEEMFRSELNSKLADQMSEATANQFTGPMFELFNLQRAN